MSNLPMQQLGLPMTITKEFDNSEGEVLAYILKKPKTFQEYTNEDKQKLGVYFVAISKYLGIKEPLDDVQRKLLVNTICKEMPTFTYEEMNKAIQMASMGKFSEKDNLGRQVGVDNNHYQHLSPQYISAMVNAYKKHRGNVYQKYRRLQERIRREKEPENISKKDAFYLGLELVENEFNDYEVNPERYCDTEYRDTQFKHLYFFLTKHKLIEPKELTETEDLKKYIISWFKALQQELTAPREYITKRFNIPPTNE